MKTKLYLSFVLLAVSGLNAAVSEATDGAGTRGGGETIVVKGHPELRDIGDGTVCEWHAMTSLLRTYAPLVKVLKKIAPHHPYFVWQLPSTATDLKVCFTTARLPRMANSELDFLTAEAPSTEQVAARMENYVYINVPLFGALTAEHRGFLLIHEISHSFIPMRAPGRTALLRSFVKMLFTIESASSEDILANQSSNAVNVGFVSPLDWPTVRRLLDPTSASSAVRAATLGSVLVGSPAVRKERACYFKVRAPEPVGPVDFPYYFSTSAVFKQPDEIRLETFGALRLSSLYFETLYPACIHSFGY